MNQIQYDQLQVLLADMISLRDEDPNTEGYLEAIPHELEYYIWKLVNIFKVELPTKTCRQLYEEIYDCDPEMQKILKRLRL